MNVARQWATVLTGALLAFQSISLQADKNIREGMNMGLPSNPNAESLRIIRGPQAASGEGTASPSRRYNHEGRFLGTMPRIDKPVMFNTPEADAILASLQVMPVDNPWNEDIRDRPVLPYSVSMIRQIGAELSLKVNRDMGFIIVPPNQELVPLALGIYATESDFGPFPIPPDMPIEGWPMDGTSLAKTQAEGTGDRHAIVVDPVNNMLYEMGETYKTPSGWAAAGSAKFSLASNALRPLNWTSTDAAGLPIFPGVVRYDEVQRGQVEHAVRFTVEKTKRAYIYPATHYASNLMGTTIPAMGQRFRLKSSVSLEGLSPHALAVAKGLQKYGMILADNGGNWRISVAPDTRIKGLEGLSRFKGSDFDVIETTGPNEGPRARR